MDSRPSVWHGLLSQLLGPEETTCTKCGRIGTQILTFSFGTLAALWVVGVLFSPCSGCLFLFYILFAVISPSFMVSLVAVKGQKVFELCFELIVDVLCGSVDACRPVNRKKRHTHWKQFSFGQPESWTKTPCNAFQSIGVVPFINMFLEWRMKDTIEIIIWSTSRVYTYIFFNLHNQARHNQTIWVVFNL